MGDSVVRNTGGTVDFRKLIKEDSSAFKITDDGKVVRSGTMALRSGLHWMIGGTKVEDDHKSNQKTLNFLLDEIERQSRPGIGDKVREMVLDSVIDIGDGKKLTVAQRLERGTYVSSRMVAELNMAMSKAVLEFSQDELREAEGVRDRYNDGLRGVANFLGKTPPQDGIGDVIVDGLRDIGRMVFGEGEVPVTDCIRDLCRNGTEEFPREQEQLWQNVEKTLVSGTQEQRESFLRPLEHHLKGVAATIAKTEGRVVTEDDLKRATIRFLTNPIVMARFVDLTNQNIIANMGPHEIAQGVREWAKVNNRPELQNACDWLANELELSADPNWQKLVRPLQDMQQSEGLIGALKSFFTIISYDESRDLDRIGERVYQTIQQTHEKTSPPEGLTDLERFRWLQESLNNDNDEVIEAFFKPHQYGPEDFARLMGNTIESLLVDHKEKMDNLNGEEVQLLENARKNLDEALPIEVFFHLRSLKDSMTDDAMRWIGQPETAGDFVKGMLRLGMHQTISAGLIGDAKKESGSEILDNNTQMRIVDETRSFVGKEMETLDKLLPSLDDYRRFEQEVIALREQPGGLKGADPETLKRLDETAHRLLDQSREIAKEGEDIKQRFGEKVKQPTSMMETCSTLMTNGARRYLQESGGHQRNIEEMQRLAQEGMEIARSLLETLENLKLPEPLPEVPWATPYLNAQLRTFPSLHDLALEVPTDSTGPLSLHKSIAELMRGLVLPPHQEALSGQFEDLSDIRQLNELVLRRKDSEVAWDENVTETLKMLDDFSALDQFVQTLDTESWQAFGAKGRQDLRESVQNHMKSVEDLDRLIDSLPGRFPSGSLDQVSGALREAGQRVLEVGQYLLDMFDEHDRLEQERPTETVQTVQTGETVQTGGTGPTNPFEDDDEDVPPPTGETVRPPTPQTTQTGSNNPFDEDVPPTTQTARTGSNNPFDDDDDVRPTTQTTRTGSTNPFDDDVRTGSTNPFDDDVLPTVTNTNPFDDEVPTTAQTGGVDQPELPREVTQQLDLFPGLREMALGLSTERMAPLTTVAGTVQALLFNRFGDDEERLRGEFSGFELESRLSVLDQFAFLQQSLTNLGDGLREIGFEGAQMYRQQLQEILDALPDLENGRELIALNTLGEDVEIEDLDGALEASAQVVRDGCQSMLTRLNELYPV